MQQSLAGKAAVITGSSRGVGRATALALARRGCAVVLNFISNREKAEAVAAEVRAAGVEARVVQGDIADDAACRSLMAEAVESFGRIDILINNAAVTRFVAFDQMEAIDAAVWDRIFAVNVRGVFQCVRAARRHLEASGDGQVINVASIAGLTGKGSSIPYCASKAALITLTASLARTLAPAVRVNAVAPGFIETDWTRQGLGANYESGRREHERGSALRRVSQPEDVSDAILGLLCGSRMVTGQTLVVDGGALLGPRPG